MLNVEQGKFQPLRSVAELVAWSQPSESSLLHVLTRSRVPLPAPSSPRAPRARLLVAHDFRGGYGADACLHGSGDAHAYTMHDGWRLCDAFVYFAHELVSVPPVGWIEAAHRHRCPVYGTFITEWDQGRHALNALLQTPQRAAEQLVAIAVYFGFDGWLVNIENHVDNLPALKLFVAHLAAVSRAKSLRVVWYDSVLATTGELRWQNTLNRNNYAWFEMTDGIFTNYAWQAGTPASAASLAAPRERDVYFGIDVHGRNTFGGGGMTCDAACRVALAAQTSVALFAPGWTHENFDARVAPRVSRLFWDRLAPFFAPVRHALPFWTNFFPGASAGRRVFVCGAAAVGETTVLSQLRLLRAQLSWSFEGAVEQAPERAAFFSVQLCESDAFLGTCCVQLRGWLNEAPDRALVRLFATDFACDAGLTVSVSLKLGAQSECALLLTLDNGALVVLAADLETGALAAAATCVVPARVDVRANGWLRRTFDVGALAGRRVERLSAVALLSGTAEHETAFSCLIGDVGVRASDAPPRCPPIVRCETREQTLVWHHSEPASDVTAYVVRWRDGSAQLVPTNACGERAAHVAYVAPVLSDGTVEHACVI